MANKKAAMKRKSTGINRCRVRVFYLAHFMSVIRFVNEVEAYVGKANRNQSDRQSYTWLYFHSPARALVFPLRFCCSCDDYRCFADLHIGFFPFPANLSACDQGQIICNFTNFTGSPPHSARCPSFPRISQPIP